MRFSFETDFFLQKKVGIEFYNLFLQKAHKIRQK